MRFRSAQILVALILFALLCSGCDKEDSAGVEPSAPAQQSTTVRDTTSGGAGFDQDNRSLYPDISFVSDSELAANFLNYMLIDVRSNFEFRIIRMRDAISIPANDPDVSGRLINLVRKHKPSVVLYGNGGGDRQPHSIARLAAKENIDNIYVYDGSLEQWAEKHPQLTEVRGKALSDDNAITSQQQLQTNQLDRAAFESGFLDQAGDALLVDVRSGDDHGRYKLQSRAINIPLDHTDRLNQTINAAQLKKQTLYFYDADGMAVRWLADQLLHLGFDQFYYLEGGIP